MTVNRPIWPAILGMVLSLALGTAQAADKVSQSASDGAYAAGKAAEIETLRARASMGHSAGVSSTLMEADDLLRRFRQAPAVEKQTLRAQLDSVLARVELELSRPR